MVVSDHELANSVLKDAQRYVIPRNLLLEPIPVEQQDQWRVARKLLNPTLRHEQVRKKLPDLVQVLRDQIAQGPTSSADALAAWTEVAGRASAHYLLGPTASRTWPHVTAMMQALAPMVGNLLAPPAFVPSRARTRMQTAFNAVDASIRATLQSGSVNQEGDSAAHAIVGAAKLTPNPVPLERISRLVAGALLASHTIPAAAIAWTLWLLGEQPAWREAIRDEASTVVRRAEDGTSPVGTHSWAAVREATRLFPPTWLLRRRSTVESELGGYLIRPNTTVLVSPYVIHRRQETFDDPHDFRPQRWLTHPHHPGYLGFGIGPRACPGSSLAEAICAIAIALVHSEWNYELAAGSPPTPSTAFSLTPEGLRGHFQRA